MKPGTQWKVMFDYKKNGLKFLRNGGEVFPTEAQLAEARKFSIRSPFERNTMEIGGEAAQQLVIANLDKLMFPEDQ